MKTITRDQQNTDVNFIKIDGNNHILIGTFFKEKPKIGDKLNNPVNKISIIVKEIIKNRDAKIHQECKKNPKNAWFKIRF